MATATQSSRRAPASGASTGAARPSRPFSSTSIVASGGGIDAGVGHPGEVAIGGVSLPLFRPAGGAPSALVPMGYLPEELDQGTLAHLRWLLQKVGLVHAVAGEGGTHMCA